ncbi:MULTISPECIES: AMP-binding protein [unclassified Paraburkholderia]|uniref:AMP-binding protein n=1 Tax=unclassified Paraburkholderia TaxID=2615204 RepID=UPI00288965C3|nr:MULTISPECIES: AMP-binding protein [unclassified Paraburkholderia]
MRVMRFPQAFRANSTVLRHDWCSGACACLLPEWHSTSGPKAGKLTSVGQPTSSFEIRIVDEQGCLCETGTVGEIQIRGPAVMRGYWRDPLKTSDTIKDGCCGRVTRGIWTTKGFSLWQIESRT